MLCHSLKMERLWTQEKFKKAASLESQQSWATCSKIKKKTCSFINDD